MKMTKKHQNYEEEPLWFSIMMWTIIIVVFVGVLFTINHFMPKDTPPIKRCTNECDKFKMGYYKTDPHTGSKVTCWCVDDDKKPRSVGRV